MVKKLEPPHVVSYHKTMSSSPSDKSVTGGTGRRRSWRSAFAWAIAGLYGPQLIICLYTVAAASCSHCKKTIWMVAPVGPGLFLHAWIKQLPALRDFFQANQFIISGLLSILLLGGVTLLHHRFPRVRIVLFFITFSGSMIAALGLLAAIRA